MCLSADMSDMLEDADEVNEIMGRAYGSDLHTAPHNALVAFRITFHRILLTFLTCFRCLTAGCV